MGCSSSSAVEASTGAPAAVTRPDEAWYAETRRILRFRQLCHFGQIGWVTVRYLRGLRGALSRGQPLPRRQEVPEAALVVGAPPPGVRLWVVSHPWLGKQHADVTGEQMLEIIGRLENLSAADDDAVFYDYLSMFQKRVDDVDDRSAEQKDLFRRGLRSINELYSSPFCNVVITTTIPKSACGDAHEVPVARGGAEKVRVEPNRVPYVSRGWCFSELFVALLFQRQTQLDEVCLKAVKEMAADIFSRVTLAVEADRAVLVEQAVELMLVTEEKRRVRDAEIGSYIDGGEAAFVRAGYLRELLRNGGHVQRRQDLPRSAMVSDWRAHRLYLSIYTFLTSTSDTGRLDPEDIVLSEMVEKLDIVNADDEDGVFMHSMSLLQPETDEERRQFVTCLHRSTMLYMSPRFQVFICSRSFHRRGIDICSRGWPLILVLAAAFTGSLVYDDNSTVDLIVQNVFMRALETKVFTSGLEDMEIVGRLFKTLLYRRAGMDHLLEFSQ